MASARLAEAFQDRETELKGWGWLFGFSLSVIGLVIIGIITVHTLNTTGAGNYWQFILERFLIGSPLIWSAWFCAIQYGNAIRLKEDYAFKAATAKAFVGYKDYFEDLAKVEGAIGGNAITALQLLSMKTIKILAKSPGRLLDKTHKDASFLSVLKKKSKKNY